MRKINPDNWSLQSCRICDTKFLRLKSRIRRGDGKYCSMNCLHESRKTRIERKCRVCGKSFFSVPSRLFEGKGKYCSRACLWQDAEYLRTLSSAIQTKFRKGHSTWNKGLTKESSPIMKIISDKVRINNPSIRPDVRRKMSEARKGMKPWNFGKECPQLAGKNSGTWKGGYEPYYGPNWHSQKKLALLRDNHKCRKCGKSASENGRELDVHHVIAFNQFSDYRKANDLRNLLSLCISCHRKIEGQKKLKIQPLMVICS